MRRRHLAGVVAAGAGLLVVLASAHAYVRSRTSMDNSPLAWAESCAYLTPDSSLTPDVPSDQVLAAIEASAATWNSPGCSYFELKVDPPAPGGSAIMERPTAQNFIVFRQDSWCPPEPEEPCYDSNATAITTVFYFDKPGATQNGRILDADIELNNVNFAFTVDGTRPPGSGSKPVADIENTLTHELGHLLGLDHTCYDGWNPCEAGACRSNHLACQTDDDCIPLDDQGARIPRCTDPLPAEVTEATMYNYAPTMDTSKRSLSQDDVDGVCGLYPVAQDPARCKRVYTADGRGCHAAAGGRSTGRGLPLLLALAVLRFTRRRRA